MRNGNHGVIGRKAGNVHPPLLNRSQYHRHTGKKTGSVSLHEIGSGSPDRDDQIRRMRRVQSSQIRDEGRLRIITAEPGGNKRVILNIQMPRRKPVQLLPD